MEYGAILPNNQPSPLETYQGLENQQYNRNVQAYQMQQDAQNRQFQIAKYVGDKLDPSTYGTGMDTDILANKYAHDAMQELTGMIQNNASPAEIAMRTAQHAGYLSNYAEKARTIDANAKAFGASLSKDPSIDANKAYNYYKWQALHDGNGGILPIDKIDPSQDYSQSVLDKYGDHIVKGPQAIDAFVKGQDKRTVNPETTVNIGGIKHKIGYSGEIFPSMQEMVDDKGNVITDPSKQIPTGMRLKSKMVVLPNGQQAEVADDGVYNQLTQSIGTRLYLRQQAKAAGFDPDSQMGQIAMQRMAQEYLHNKNIGYWMKSKDDIDNSQQERENFSRSMKYLGDSLIRSRKEEDAKVKDNPLFGVIAGMSGNSNYRSPEPVDWEGKKVYEFTPFVHGAAVYSGKNVMKPDGTASKEAFAGIGQNAETGNLIVRKVDTKSKKTGDLSYENKEIEPKDEFDWFKKVGEANGMSAPQITQIYNQSLGKTVNERQAKYEQDHGFYNKHETGPIFGQPDQLPEQAAPVQEPFHKRVINKIKESIKW